MKPLVGLVRLWWLTVAVSAAMIVLFTIFFQWYLDFFKIGSEGSSALFYYLLMCLKFVVLLVVTPFFLWAVNLVRRGGHPHALLWLRVILWSLLAVAILTGLLVFAFPFGTVTIVMEFALAIYGLRSVSKRAVASFEHQ
jgi:hypothetical protein